MLMIRAHRLNHRFPVRLMLLGGLVGFLFGCHSMSLHGKPYTNAARFLQHPPRTLAILPPTDHAGYPKLSQAVRGHLAAQLADRNYETIKTRRVDRFLANKAASQGVSTATLSRDDMIDPHLADCVMFVQLDKVSRLYLFFYAHFQFDINVTMVETRTRQVLYQNHFSFYDRLIDFVGLTEGPVEALWYLRPQRLPDSLEKGVQQIAMQLPEPGPPDPSPFATFDLSTVSLLPAPSLLSARAQPEETY